MSTLLFPWRYEPHNKFRHYKHLYRIISVIHYNALIHHRNCHSLPALNVLHKQNGDPDIHWITYRLHHLDKSPDSFTYTSLLQVCNIITTLKKVHAQIIATGLEQNIFLGSKIINMYSLWSCIEDARNVFDKIRQRNVFIWNVMIRGYAMNESWGEAFAIYCQMQQAGIQPDNFTFTFILKACAELLSLQEGKEIHGHIVKTGSELDVFVSNSLIYMYVKCGVVEHARRVFGRIPEKDVVSWNTMITGYAQNGHEVEALGFFNQMQLVEMKANLVNMVSVIQACTHLGVLLPGKSFHNHSIKSGFEADVFLRNSLIDMYAKCGCIDSAQRIFDKMLDRNVISWSALIAGYAQNGLANEALSLFDRMQRVDVVPNSVTMVSVLQACTRFGDLQQGKLIHDYVIQRRLDSDVFVANSLMDMFAKIGGIDVAQNLFDRMSTRNVASWNIIIAGYAHNRYPKEALMLFNKMQLVKMQPNSTTIVNVLQVFTSLVALQQGLWIHRYIIKRGFESDIFVGNSLIDVYAKCGRIDFASRLFGIMPKRDVVSWSTLISAHGMHGYGKDALAFLRSSNVNFETVEAILQEMHHFGASPNALTYKLLLIGCIRLGKLDSALKFMKEITQKGNHPYKYTYKALLKALLKEGNLEAALDVFEDMLEVNFLPAVRTVNNLMMGLCRVGKIEEAYHLLRTLLGKGFSPNVFSYNPLILGLCKAGKNSSAIKIFCSMKGNGCSPNVYTYTALVYGFSEEGKWEEAYSVLDEMASEGCNPNVVTFTTLINGLCKKGNIKEASRVLDMMVKHDCSPDLVTYNIILHALCNAMKFLEACQLMDVISNKGFYPDIYTYTALIGGLCKVGQVAEAHKLLQDLLRKGYVLDIVTCNIFFNGLCQKYKSEEACALLTNMECKGYRPNLVTYNTLLNGLCKEGKLQQAFQLFNELSYRGCSPDTVSYNIMISALCKDGNNFRTIRELLGKMHVEGCTPNVVTYTSLIYYHCRVGTLCEAFQLLNCMPKQGCLPSVVTYNILLDSLCKKGNLQEAYRLFSVMSNKGCTPDQISYNILIHAFCRAGQMSTSEMMVHDMHTKGWTPDVFTYGSIMYGHCKVGSVNKALELYDEMLENGYRPSIILYNILLYGLCKEGKEQQVSKLLLNMAIDGCGPDTVSYSILKHSIARGSGLLESLKLLNYLIMCGRLLPD